MRLRASLGARTLKARERLMSRLPSLSQYKGPFIVQNRVKDIKVTEFVFSMVVQPCYLHVNFIKGTGISSFCLLDMAT